MGTQDQTAFDVLAESAEQQMRNFRLKDHPFYDDVKLALACEVQTPEAIAKAKVVQKDVFSRFCAMKYDNPSRWDAESDVFGIDDIIARLSNKPKALRSDLHVIDHNAGRHSNGNSRRGW